MQQWMWRKTTNVSFGLWHTDSKCRWFVKITLETRVCVWAKKYITIGMNIIISVLNIIHAAVWLLQMHTSRCWCWNDIPCSPNYKAAGLTQPAVEEVHEHQHHTHHGHKHQHLQRRIERELTAVRASISRVTLCPRGLLLPTHRRTRTHARTHTQTHRERYIHTHTHTEREIQTHTHRDTHTHRERDTHTHTHTHIHITHTHRERESSPSVSTRYRALLNPFYFLPNSITFFSVSIFLDSF